MSSQVRGGIQPGGNKRNTYPLPLDYMKEGSEGVAVACVRRPLRNRSKTKFFQQPACFNARTGSHDAQRERVGRLPGRVAPVQESIRWDMEHGTTHRATWRQPPQRLVRGSGMLVLPTLVACNVSVPRDEWDRVPDIGQPWVSSHPEHEQSGDAFACLVLEALGSPGGCEQSLPGGTRRYREKENAGRHPTPCTIQIQDGADGCPARDASTQASASPPALGLC